MIVIHASCLLARHFDVADRALMRLLAINSFPSILT